MGLSRLFSGQKQPFVPPDIDRPYDALSKAEKKWVQAEVVRLGREADAARDAFLNGHMENPEQEWAAYVEADQRYRARYEQRWGAQRAYLDLPPVPISEAPPPDELCRLELGAALRLHEYVRAHCAYRTADAEAQLSALRADEATAIAHAAQSSAGFKNAKGALAAHGRVLASTQAKLQATIHASKVWNRAWVEASVALALAGDDYQAGRREAARASYDEGNHSLVIRGIKDGGFPTDAIESMLVLDFGLGVEEADQLIKTVQHVESQPLIDGISLDQAIALKDELEIYGIEVQVKSGAAPRTEVQRRAPIPEAVRHEVWRRDGGQCVDCGSRERLEFDHIIPHSKGGSDTARNLELRCESCNRRKAASI